MPFIFNSSLISLCLQVNNGQFLGNFLGTVLAALSAVFIPFNPLDIPLLLLLTVLLTKIADYLKHYALISRTVRSLQDPEDEGPPQPLTFTKSFLSSFIESKFRMPEASEERHGSADLPHPKKKESSGWHGSGGFDSGGFVKQIASHLVSSALGLLLNASLGAASGASHASTGLFASSSHHVKPAAARSWEQL